MTRLLARPAARLRPRYGAVRGQRRQQRTRCSTEGRGQAAAGPRFQAGTFYSPVGRGENFPERLGGENRALLVVRARPCTLAGEAAGGPAPRPARRPSCRARAPAGRAAVLPPREGGRGGGSSRPCPAVPRGSRVLRAALPCVSAVRAEMEFLRLSPPLLNI